MSEAVSKAVREANPEFDSKLIPVLREAIMMVQMILFRCLKENLQQRQQQQPEEELKQLAGAVVNNLYGTEPTDPAINQFVQQQRQLIEAELRLLHTRVAELMPHITDSLRMQTICDNHEGIHSIPSLLLAKELGLLAEERPLPMPSTFMLSVRQLGAKYGLVEAIKREQPKTTE